MLFTMSRENRPQQSSGNKKMLVAGVDEAGRGPLAGPVVAAAVILDPHKPIQGLKDSKKMSPKKREVFSALIKKNCLAYAVARIEAEEIDKINILQASLLAMRNAVLKLLPAPEVVLVDGNHLPDMPFQAKSIIGGDNLEPCISAASILAKVARDTIMLTFDGQYPDYGFAQHKGYPTKNHINALKVFGVSEIHRRSFSPVSNYICTEKQ